MGVIKASGQVVAGMIGGYSIPCYRAYLEHESHDRTNKPKLIELPQYLFGKFGFSSHLCFKTTPPGKK
jgi:hypothetical protein